MNNTPWGYFAAFPCQTQSTSQPVATRAGNVALVSYDCSEGQDFFYVDLTDYPQGTLSRENSNDAYNAAANGAAATTKGTVRAIVPDTLGNVTGRDVLIDVPSGHLTGHLRYFIVGDRLYQAYVFGPAGDENSKPVLDFLNSFGLTK